MPNSETGSREAEGLFAPHIFLIRYTHREAYGAHTVPTHTGRHTGRHIQGGIPTKDTQGGIYREVYPPLYTQGGYNLVYTPLYTQGGYNPGIYHQVIHSGKLYPGIYTRLHT